MRASKGEREDAESQACSLKGKPLGELSLLMRVLKCQVLWLQMHFPCRTLTERRYGTPDDISVAADLLPGLSHGCISIFSFSFKIMARV